MNIYINPMAFHKMRVLTDLSPVEVSGIGPVVLTKGRLYIPDFFVPKQTNSHTETEFDDQSMTDTLIDSSEAFRGAPLSFWWHSHVEMGVSQSGTDVTTMRTMAARGFCVATIINKRGEVSTMFCSKGDMGNYIPPFELEAKLVLWSPDDIAIKELYDSRCIRKTYPAYNHGGYLAKNIAPSLLTNHNLVDDKTDEKDFKFKEDEEKLFVTQKEAYALAKEWQFDYNKLTKKNNSYRSIVKDIMSVVTEWEYKPKDAKDLHDCLQWLIDDETNGGETSTGEKLYGGK